MLTAGTGTLRADLAAAGQGDTINFAPNVRTIDITSTLVVDKNVTIDGGGTAFTPGVAIDGGGRVTDFTIEGSNVAIDGLTVTGGVGVGANGDSGLGNSAVTSGAGGVYVSSSGTLTISNSTFLNDSATGGTGESGEHRGGPFSGAPGAAGGSAAGGIYVASGATLNLVGQNSFIGNSATGGTGGQGAESAPFRDGAGGFHNSNPGGAGGLGGMSSTPGTGSGGGNGGTAGQSGAPGNPGITFTAGGFTFTAGASGAGGNGGTAYADYGGDGVIELNGVSLCFTTGTPITTTRGDMLVENLAVGDVAVTAARAERPIVWIGHRLIEKPAFDQYPVRISAGAFGGGLPECDLFLSPGHPVLAGCHLVPIMSLINGTTIARVEVDRVTYWHVELDQHDILLAGGLPAESYIDLGSRPWFFGADNALQNPDLVLAGQSVRCRPIAIEGAVVDAERRRLDVVFATRLHAACSWPSAAAGDAGAYQRAERC